MDKEVITHEQKYPWLVRVFPRRTKATPKDGLSFIGKPPIYKLKNIEEVHVSCTFTWDKPKAEWLAKLWTRAGYNVKIGGPAFDAHDDDFIPGRYLAHNNVITSRGCPNNCWFCWVPKREGGIREIPIEDGWIMHDSNLLACSDNHINAVLDMLDRQPERAIFAGGVEALLVKDWHIKRFKEIKVRKMYFAYDTPDDLKPLQDVGKRLIAGGFTPHSQMQAFVLIGWPKDTMEAAEKRLWETVDAGFMPYAMLFRDKKGKFKKAWRKFQYMWSNQIYVGTTIKNRNKQKETPQSKPTIFNI